MAYTKAELDKKTVPELRALAEKEGLELVKTDTKASLKIKLLSIEENDDELDDDEFDDSDTPANDEGGLDDDEVDDEELDDSVLDEDEELDDIDEEPAKPAKKSAAKKTSTPKSADGEATLAAKQVATILGTEAKTLRQFFRSEASTTEAVGSGGRYEFLETDIEKIKEEFVAWKAAHAARGTKRGAGKSTKAAAPVEEIEEVEEIAELEELDDEIDDEDLELDDEELDD